MHFWGTALSECLSRNAVVGVKGVSGYYAAIKDIEVLAILKPTRLRACTAKV